MAYAGRRACAGEAEARAKRAKEYLIKVRGVNAERIVTVDGGHREEPAVELYLVPPGARPPLSTPTVEPGEVQTIKARHVRNIRRPSQKWCK
jgi:alkanesulfonate monooxygenase SsuD/methylene tetrahydromethanopterin reductase-like flavin-dependent oxidoreductase (luciferase family)